MCFLVVYQNNKIYIYNVTHVLIFLQRSMSINQHRQRTWILDPCFIILICTTAKKTCMLGAYVGAIYGTASEPQKKNLYHTYSQKNSNKIAGEPRRYLHHDRQQLVYESFKHEKMCVWFSVNCKIPQLHIATPNLQFQHCGGKYAHTHTLMNLCCVCRLSISGAYLKVLIYWIRHGTFGRIQYSASIYSLSYSFDFQRPCNQQSCV